MNLPTLRGLSETEYSPAGWAVSAGGLAFVIALVTGMKRPALVGIGAGALAVFLARR